MTTWDLDAFGGTTPEDCDHDKGTWIDTIYETTYDGTTLAVARHDLIRCGGCSAIIGEAE